MTDDTNSQNTEDKQKIEIDNRHFVRQVFVQYIYEKNFQEKFPEELIKFELELPEQLDFPNISGKLQRKIKKGLRDNETLLDDLWKEVDSIDDIIKKYATEWPIEQINPVDLAILRLGIFEGFIAKSIPAKVAIDESIELAKDFGDEPNINFISGVMGQIYKDNQ